MTKLYGSLEAGGTKFVCAVGDENYNVVEKVQFPTTKPIETIDKCIEFSQNLRDLVGLRIGSFGPIDIDPNSNTYGFITTTPKPNWANVDIVGAFRRSLNVPIYFTTDVNSSAYGEVVARNNAGGHIKTWFTIQSEQESELVSSNVVSLSGSWAPRNGTLLCGSTPNGCGKRIQGCLSFPQWLFGRFCGWSKS